MKRCCARRCIPTEVQGWTVIHTKKQLRRAIRKETKPPKGFGQWLITLEQRRISEDIGLFRVEAEIDGKLQWSAAVSVNLPEAKKFDSTGREIVSEWDRIALGKSLFNVFTLETRGKSVVEVAKGWLKRSFEEGKIQDIIPFVKG